MTYRDAIRRSMEMLAEDPLIVFIGYNLKYGSKGYKTLNQIDSSKIIETPVAENLMAGLAIGMSLEGYKPILIFERHDFMLNALDSLVNHLDKLPQLSNGDYNPKIIIRAIIGRKEPINPGPQHMQDFSEFFKQYLKFPVYDPGNEIEVLEIYQRLKDLKGASMVIERSELYKT